MTTTHTGTPDYQVLVVGAGPTGLTLAAQLLARGIHARVIDKGEGLAPQNRAVAIHARTLELLDTMGLADAFIDQGHRVRRFRWYAGQRNLLDLDLARNGSQYGFVLHLPQSQPKPCCAPACGNSAAPSSIAPNSCAWPSAATPSTPHSATPPAGRFR